jgi:hypothetical protein
VKQSKCLEPLFLDLLSPTNEHGIRSKIAVDVLVELEVILIDGSFRGTQTDFVRILQAALRFDPGASKRLQLIFEIRWHDERLLGSLVSNTDGG